MHIREIITKRWGEIEILTSPIFGTIEEVIVKGNSVKEFDPLFIIRNEQGALEKITAGLNGIIELLNVKKVIKSFRERFWHILKMFTSENDRLWILEEQSPVG